MRRSKFNAVPTVIDNVRFASKREAKRYQELKILANAGEISGLELQRRFSLEVNGQKICDYISDFDYFDADGKPVVEDAKGVKTSVYKLKKKLMKAIHGIDVVEV